MVKWSSRRHAWLVSLGAGKRDASLDGIIAICPMPKLKRGSERVLAVMEQICRVWGTLNAKCEAVVPKRESPSNGARHQAFRPSPDFNFSGVFDVYANMPQFRDTLNSLLGSTDDTSPTPIRIRDSDILRISGQCQLRAVSASLLYYIGYTTIQYKLLEKIGLELRKPAI